MSPSPIPSQDYKLQPAEVRPGHTRPRRAPKLLSTCPQAYRETPSLQAQWFHPPSCCPFRLSQRARIGTRGDKPGSDLASKKDGRPGPGPGLGPGPGVLQRGGKGRALSKDGVLSRPNPLPCFASCFGPGFQEPLSTASFVFLLSPLGSGCGGAACHGRIQGLDTLLMSVDFYHFSHVKRSQVYPATASFYARRIRAPTLRR